MMRSQKDPEDTNATKKKPRSTLRWELMYFMINFSTEVFLISIEDFFIKGS
jgi:hypothetical protein